MKRLNHAGSHIIGIALVVLALSVAGFAGYTVMQARNKPVDNSQAATTTTKTTSSAPATIKSSADLTQAATVLDDSASQLNSGLDDSSLNADLNSML